MIKIIKSANPNEKFVDCIVLEPSKWDDYGYKTTYIFSYYNNSGELAFYSSIQVYCTELDNEDYMVHRRVVDHFVDREIIQLDERFCSLGIDLNFYLKLKEHIPYEYKEILHRLNDLAYDEELWKKFQHYEGVQRSLLRSSSALKARNEAYKMLEKQEDKKYSLSFCYDALLPYYDGEIRLFFSFEKKEKIPYRLNALVGKNGTGKTQILNQLAKDLSGFHDDDEKNKNRDAFGTQGRPAFDKVMSISYSAFDSFKNLRGDESLKSYVYCGIQSEKGTLQLKEIQSNFREALQLVKKKSRYTIWKKIITELFEEENYNIVNEVEENGLEEIFWSSGQHVLISSMTEVISKIDRESIILFDEPEIHLHPNAIANVMRMFHMILDEFDSYAIIATHSPIILQEIPSKNIVVLERIDNQPFVRRPEIECFGENISQITRDIFDVSNRESCYQTVFRDLKAQGKTKLDIEEIFNGNLGLNATIYLESLYR